MGIGFNMSREKIVRLLNITKDNLLLTLVREGVITHEQMLEGRKFVMGFDDPNDLGMAVSEAFPNVKADEFIVMTYKPMHHALRVNEIELPEEAQTTTVVTRCYSKACECEFSEAEVQDHPLYSFSDGDDTPKCVKCGEAWERTKD